MTSTGAKPFHTLSWALAALVPLREPNETIVVHHFTDSPARLQLEIERRSRTLGITFERFVFDEPL